MRVREALASGTQAIQAHHVSQTPLLDASLLLSTITGLSREQLYIKSEVLLSSEAVQQYNYLVSQRCEAQPVAYLLGKREFYGRTFIVNPQVLIPRPDTETLVELTLEHIRKLTCPTVLDLCTGSGCIGISVAAEAPHADVTLTDISREALQIAQKNVELLLERPVHLVQSNLFSALIDQKYSIITSNPPYLTPDWYEETEKQVKAEPALALLGGDSDGLAIIRDIIAQAPHHLYPDGVLLIECDYRQVEAVQTLFEEHGFSQVSCEYDLAQLQRVVWGVYDV
jgi:release factor glutamine methyltransferase